eukprot:916430-Amphidinium_carterae.1
MLFWLLFFIQRGVLSTALKVHILAWNAHQAHYDKQLKSYGSIGATIAVESKSCGYGFVHYDDSANVEKAMGALNGTRLGASNVQALVRMQKAGRCPPTFRPQPRS